MRVGVGVCEPSSCWGSPLPCHPSHQLCCPHPLTVMPARWSSLGSSPVLLLALGWCSLCIAAVIGGGVAVIGCAVVIGMPRCRLHRGRARRNIISALKIERKNNSRVGPGGVASQPRRWSPLWSPRTRRQISENL